MLHATHNNHLCLHNITFERNYFPLFVELNQTFNSGDVIQIRGHNGCGKSTLLRILAGLIEPHEGKITWNGDCIFQYRDNYLKNIAYMGHLNGIKSILTVYENLSLQATLRGYQNTPQELKNIIKKFGLTPLMHRHAKNLSAGQLRRLCLARLALESSRIWFLDEPITALDNSGLALLHTLLQNHIENHGIAVIATHQTISLPYPIKTIYLGEYDVV